MNNKPMAWTEEDLKKACRHAGLTEMLILKIKAYLPVYTHPTKTPTDDFIYKNHMGYVSSTGNFYAPDYPTWKQDGFVPVYKEPVIKELTDEEIDTIVRDFFGEVESFYDFRLVIRRCIRKTEEK